jgi:hypothetical protein
MLNNPAIMLRMVRLINWLGVLLPFRLLFFIIFQFVLIALSYTGSYFLYFGGLIPEHFFRIMIITLPIFWGVQGSFTYYYAIHRGLWRNPGCTDPKNILRAARAGLVVIVILGFFIRPDLGKIPPWIMVNDLLLLITLTGGCRLMRSRDRISAGGNQRPEPQFPRLSPLRYSHCGGYPADRCGNPPPSGEMASNPDRTNHPRGPAGPGMELGVRGKLRV